VSATADLHVDGWIEGDVTCATMVQGEGATIVGTLTAERARIGGRIEGALVARFLVVEASARISGDVSYETLTMAEGAKIEGKLVCSAPKDAVAEPLKLIAAGE